MLSDVLSEYKDVIKVGLFGHRNEASVSTILSASQEPLMAALTAPGVSPRGTNNPAFLILQQDIHTGSLIDFEQQVFDLFNENKRIQQLKVSPDRYMGSWNSLNGRLRSWQALSGINVTCQL